MCFFSVKAAAVEMQQKYRELVGSLSPAEIALAITLYAEAVHEIRAPDKIGDPQMMVAFRKQLESSVRMRDTLRYITCTDARNLQLTHMTRLNPTVEGVAVLVNTGPDMKARDRSTIITGSARVKDLLQKKKVDAMKGVEVFRDSLMYELILVIFLSLTGCYWTAPYA
jgi:hypothetical protein